jgi:hypothetical protein
VKLPTELLAAHFDTSFKRGVIIKFLMTDPDDPALESRYKYALVIGLDCDEPESYLLLATSKLDKIESIRKRIPDGFHYIEAGDYGWVTMPTAVDLRKARCYPRKELIEKLNQGSLTFEGQLDPEEMAEIDTKLRVSKTVEMRLLRKIVSGVS